MTRRARHRSIDWLIDRLAALRRLAQQEITSTRAEWAEAFGLESTLMLRRAHWPVENTSDRASLKRRVLTAHGGQLEGFSVIECLQMIRPRFVRSW
mmetsp:Transcript_27123/g.54572  ORF Transcript_27123/g.54572 Transcript_27123/m.54572 type:complete len:96 (+) Transcript_27123:77-364(+)